MNIKVSKYFSGFLFLLIFLFCIIFYTGNAKQPNDLYLNKISDIFKKFAKTEIILNEEVDNYFENNYIRKYSVKEMRDIYTNIKFIVEKSIDEIKIGYSGTLNRKYILDIFYDILRVVDNSFLEEYIFELNDEEIIKNFQVISSKFKKVYVKYKILSMNV